MHGRARADRLPRLALPVFHRELEFVLGEERLELLGATVPSA
jgi:hypothetical protein